MALTVGWPSPSVSKSSRGCLLPAAAAPPSRPSARHEPSVRSVPALPAWPRWQQSQTLHDTRSGGVHGLLAATTRSVPAGRWAALSPLFPAAARPHHLSHPGGPCCARCAQLCPAAHDPLNPTTSGPHPGPRLASTHWIPRSAAHPPTNDVAPRVLHPTPGLISSIVIIQSNHLASFHGTSLGALPADQPRSLSSWKPGLAPATTQGMAPLPHSPALPALAHPTCNVPCPNSLTGCMSFV